MDRRSWIAVVIATVLEWIFGKPAALPAVSTTLTKLPTETFIIGPKYPVRFDRINVARIARWPGKTYRADIRAIMSDNALKIERPEDTIPFAYTHRKASDIDDSSVIDGCFGPSRRSRN